MSHTLPQSLRRRTPLVVVALVCVSLAGCASQERSTAPDTRVVSAVGISFEVPKGWKDLDAKQVAEGMGGNSIVGDVADQMGLTPEQFEQTMAHIDLFLFSDEGPHAGMVDNVSVLQLGGRMPNDEQLKLQFLQVGADVSDISHEQTEVGDATVAVYDAEFGGQRVQGRQIYVDVGDGPVAVTVSATERDTAADMADDILDTLAEAS